MHAMIRRYRVRLGTVEQAARHAERGFLPLLRQIPGFVSCQLVDAGNDILTCMALFETPDGTADADRKSTRLNSSHITISYAVFCLKKKKKKKTDKNNNKQKDK